MIHTLTLNPAIDRTYLLASLDRDGVSRASQVIDAASGKGVNVLRVASILGAEARATVLLGGPLGEYFRTLCEPSWSIDVLPIEQNTRLNVSLLVAEPHMTLKINEEGPKLTTAELTTVLEYLDRQLRADDWLAICGSTPNGVDGKVYLEIRDLVVERGALLALDVPNLTLPQLLEIGPDLFKPNAAEFEQITGWRTATIGDVMANARRLADRSRIDYLIVTLGELGAFIAKDGESFYLPIRDTASVQPVGAGDALLAGFLTGLSRGEPWPDAFVRGVAAGYAHATTGPTEPLTPERVVDVTALLRDSLVVPGDDVQKTPL